MKQTIASEHDFELSIFHHEFSFYVRIKVLLLFLTLFRQRNIENPVPYTVMEAILKVVIYGAHDAQAPL